MPVTVQFLLNVNVTAISNDSINLKDEFVEHY